MEIQSQVSSLAFAYTNETQKGTELPQGNEMDKQDFLELLMAELQNQDPTEPVKNEDMAANLAQFTQLEELTNIRQATEKNTSTLNDVISSVNGMISASMLGKQARSAPSMLQLVEDEDVKIPIELLGNADNLEIKIKDQEGETIRTITETNLNRGMHFITWDGTGDYGMQHSPGGYKFEVTATSPDGEPVDVNPYIEGTVESLSFDGGKVYFVIDGMKVPFSNITEINNSSVDAETESNPDNEIGG